MYKSWKGYNKKINVYIKIEKTWYYCYSTNMFCKCKDAKTDFIERYINKEGFILLQNYGRFNFDKLYKIGANFVD